MAAFSFSLLLCVGNNLPQPSVAALSDVLRLNTALRVLYIHGKFRFCSRALLFRLIGYFAVGCGIKLEGALALSEGLRHNQTLTILVLTSTPASLSAVSTSLCLSLIDNRLEDLGAASIVHSLTGNSSLQRLEMMSTIVCFELYWAHYSSLIFLCRC